MHPPGVSRRGNAQVCFLGCVFSGVFSRMFLTILTKPAPGIGNRCPLLVLDPYRNQCSA